MMNFPKNRRRITGIMMSFCLLISCIAGCASGIPGSAASVPEETDRTAAGFRPGEYDWPTEPGSDRYAGRTLRILLTIGSGGNYYDPVARRMLEYYPGLTVELNYTSGAGDVLRTEVLAQNAPDIFNCNSGDLPHYSAIRQGICAPIDPVFDVPTLDGSGRIGDLLDMDMMRNGSVDGSCYIFYDLSYICGLWYDANWFAANHLPVPDDWESLQELAVSCDAIGADVLGACGLMSHEYPTQYWWWPMVISTDKDLFADLTNLRYEAFKSPSMRRVVDKMLWLRDNGYYDTETNGMGNAETQMAFINHDFALLPCGAWLEIEMADAWTPDWQLSFLPYSFGDTQGHTYYRSDALASMISSTTENMDLVCEFYRFLFSDPASIRGSVAIHTNVYRIPGFDEQYGDLLSPSVKDALETCREMTPFTPLAGIWYPGLNAGIGDMIVALMGGDISGDEFIERGYELFRQIAEDDSIPKYRYEP